MILKQVQDDGACFRMTELVSRILILRLVILNSFQDLLQSLFQKIYCYFAPNFYAATPYPYLKKTDSNNDLQPTRF